VNTASKTGKKNKKS